MEVLFVRFDTASADFGHSIRSEEIDASHYLGTAI